MKISHVKRIILLHTTALPQQPQSMLPKLSNISTPHGSSFLTMSPKSTLSVALEAHPPPVPIPTNNYIPNPSNKKLLTKKCESTQLYRGLYFQQQGPKEAVWRALESQGRADQSTRIMKIMMTAAKNKYVQNIRNSPGGCSPTKNKQQKETKQ